jgi:hypothetical protein
MSRRHAYYALEEANALIPTLEHFFRELALLRRALGRVRETLKAKGVRVTAMGMTIPKRIRGIDTAIERYEELCRHYDLIHEEILSHGVEIVDCEVGIVNFFSWWDGEEVILNWQFGEPAVQFWLDPGETYSARRPIRQLMFDAPTGHVNRH